jgi:hypothetical protein
VSPRTTEHPRGTSSPTRQREPDEPFEDASLLPDARGTTRKLGISAGCEHKKGADPKVDPEEWREVEG